MNPHEQAYRSGQISGAQWNKLKNQKGTKSQATKMADFEDKSGKGDQGSGKLRGIPDTRSGSINTNQRASSPIASKPTKGGSVNASGSRGRNAINQNQTPRFPAGATVKGSNARKTLSAQPGRIPKMGGYYGGGGQDTQ